jgi:hypothetical protein
MSATQPEQLARQQIGHCFGAISIVDILERSV